MVDDGISGGLLWSLRMHRREGGFYWHMEVGTGRNIYKAFHWPGFASGDRYDERAVMQLMREKAYRFRASSRRRSSGRRRRSCCRSIASARFLGKARPAQLLTMCGAPRRRTGLGTELRKTYPTPMCSIDHYFTTMAQCPARTIGIGLLPATRRAIRSRPTWWARSPSIAARSSMSVAIFRWRRQRKATFHPPAKMREPCRRIVTDSLCGPVRPLPIASTGQSAGGAFTHLPRPTPTLAIETSADGKTFQPANVERKAFPSSQTVYGYLTPILFSGNDAADNATYLRIALHKTPDGGKSKTARRSGTSATPIRWKSRASKSNTTAWHLKRRCNEPESRKAAQLNSTIFIDSSARPLTSTLAAIDAAAERGERRLNVVVTILVDLTEDLHIKTFGGFTGPPPEYQAL